MKSITLSDEKYALLLQSLEQYVGDIKNVMEENDLTISVDSLIDSIKEQVVFVKEPEA